MAGIYRDSAGREVYAEEGALNSKSASRLNRMERLRFAAATANNNNAQDLAVMAAPPTLTSSNAATGALSKLYPYAANAALYRVSGGIPVENNTVAGYFLFPITKLGNGTTGAGNLSTWTGDTEDQQLAWSLTFQTDADIVEFLLRKNTTANRNYLFIVDGQFVDKTGTDVSGVSGSNVYIKLDFSALTPARKSRIITILGAGSNQHMFNRVAVGPTASISHPGSGRTDLLALFGGDSFTEGTQGLSNVASYNAWPWCATRRLGISRMYSLAIGTTGYVNDGSGNRRKMIDQINHDWNRPQFTNPDVIVIANGYNDKASASSNAAILNNIKVQAQAAWTATRGLFPDALIVVMGVFGGKTGPDADTLATENGLKAQFDTWADNFSMWIPVSTDPSPWQFGTGRVGATTGDGNSDVTTSTDNTHPSDYGHDYLAARFAHAFKDGIARMNA